MKLLRVSYVSVGIAESLFAIRLIKLYPKYFLVALCEYLVT